jgi:uncharacterized lipoprotein YddW (UPF0748 family)
MIPISLSILATFPHTLGEFVVSCVNMLSALLLSVVSQPNPEIPRDFRAAWVATVDNIDWPTKPGLSTATQQAEMIGILNTIQKLNMNAIIFQIRPHGDSMYKSKIEPWSWYLTGESGIAPNPPYDPLQFTIDEARKRNIEVHVWFNPYRANHGAQKGPMTKSHISKTNPSSVYKYGNFEWMDPGDPLVQKRSYDVFMDVLKRYDIDGIHIDDYFYPYPVKDTPFPDDRTYNAFKAKGGKLSKSDWRRKNVDDFVEKVYKGIKKEKPWVKFGISPFGIYRPGIPAGIKAGVDQYEDLSADALKWYQKGWCDYFTPQLYWPIEQTAQSFPVLLDWWKSQNKMNRHFWPGLYTGRLNEGWETSQVTRQLDMIQDRGLDGGVHFSMKSFTNNYKGINQALLAGPYQEKAIVPASPWLDGKAPAMPNVKKTDDPRVFRLEGGALDVHQHVILTEDKGKFKITGVYEGHMDLKMTTGSERMVIYAIDRVGNASAPFMLKK